MSNFCVLCKTKEELNKVLCKMESKGIMWYPDEDGNTCKPTEIEWKHRITYPYYLGVNSGYLSGFNILRWTQTVITAEDYLNNTHFRMCKGTNKIMILTVIWRK